jgi:hypothetical protein
MQFDPTKLDADELVELCGRLGLEFASLARLRDAVNAAYRQGVADERKHRTGIDPKVSNRG